MVISLIPACSENDYQESTSDETGSISFNVEWTGAPSLMEEPSVFTRALDCVASNVQTVTFEVRDEDDKLLKDHSWACDLHNGTVDGVPAGINRQLIVEGKDSQDRVLYRGVVTGIPVTAGEHYEVEETVTCDPVAIINFAFLQYRTFADVNTASKYIGWIDFTIEGNPIDLFEISQVSLNASGDDVPVSESFYSHSYYNGEWNKLTSSVEFSGPVYESGFSIEFPQGTPLPAGYYTYEATTSQGTTITTTLFFPGETVLPTVDVASMSSEWVSPDNSLHLSWDNPAGEYDQLRIIVKDQDYNDLLYVKPPANANDLMVPADIVQDITDLKHPTSARWVVQTRSYTETDDNNYARGISMYADIPSWQP
jgi:hypothetical protein